MKLIYMDDGTIESDTGLTVGLVSRGGHNLNLGPAMAAGPEAIRLLERLERHCALEAMDRLIEEGARIIGWEKTPAFRDLLEEARALLAAVRG